jgi:hypothetical protein
MLKLLVSYANTIFRIYRLLYAAAEEMTKSEKNKRRKADTKNTGDAGPSQAKKIKLADPAAQSSSTSSTDQPTSKDEPAKPAKKPPNSKGLSTMKPQVEKHIRQAASSVLATINPGISLSLEEKRAKLAEIKQVGMNTQTVVATPEQERFLLRVFKTTLKEWSTGYEDLLLLINPPPTIEKPSEDDPAKMETKFGPVPKLDPDFLLPALANYSAAKMHTGQVMTTWDHHFRAWMQVQILKSVPTLQNF